MGDVRSMLRVTVEFLWVVRRRGVQVAPSQTIDCMRATKLLGYGDSAALRHAYSAIVAQSTDDAVAVHAAFDEFFLSRTPPLTLRELLLSRGLTPEEIDAVSTLLQARATFEGAGDESAVGAALEGGAQWNHALLLAGLGVAVRKPPAALQIGFQTQRLLARAGHARAASALGDLHAQLSATLGQQRAREIEQILQQQLQLRARELRDMLEAAGTEKLRQSASATAEGALALTELSTEEASAVRRAIRAFGEKLAKAQAMRRKRARRGKLHARKTFALARRTGFVPLKLAFHRSKPKRPQLWLVCDISESVRETSRFMLELTAAAHSAFDKTRSFVFVSELREATALFDSQTANAAISQLFGGGVVPLTRNSNYARAFDQLLREHGDAIDKRTSIVILGDGRTNFLGDGLRALGELRKRARNLYWIASEPRSRWGEGDSAMARYAAICTHTLEAATLDDLEQAILRIARG